MSKGHIVHAVRSDAFAGVERYIADTAAQLHRNDWHVSVIGGDPARMRAELPADVDHYPGTSTADVVRALWSLRNIDVVHAHMTAAELASSLLKSRTRGRIFATRHFAAVRGSSRAGRLIRPIILRQVDAQISVSSFVADSIGEPSTVIYNGVPPSKIGNARPRLKTVLVLQRLETEKDTPTALRAWTESGLGDQGWRLVIHGEGRQGPELSRLCGVLGAANSVEFAGFTRDPRSALANAAIMLATAPAEPFGLAVVESMAEATPVVATAAGAHVETLGTDGAYFEPGDFRGCAAELRRLAADDDLRGQIGKRLRERQLTEFSITTHVRRLEAMYFS